MRKVRWGSILLAVVMLLTLLTVTALAAEKPVVATADAAANGEALKAAISSAEDGDTIVLSEGTYSLGTDYHINKAVSIKGAGAEKTIITGSLYYYCNSYNGTITVENVTVKAPANNTTADQGIWWAYNSSDFTAELAVKNCTIEDFLFGIGVNSSAKNCELTVENVKMVNVWCGANVSEAPGNKIKAFSVTPDSSVVYEVQVFGSGYNCYYHDYDNCATDTAHEHADLTSNDDMPKIANGDWPAVAKVNNKYYGDLQTALTAASTGSTIELVDNITLDTMLTGVSGKTITIEGKNHKISFSSAACASGVFGNNTAPLCENSKLTVKNVYFENTDATQGGYASIVGYNAHKSEIVYNYCKFENLYAAVYVNPIDSNPDEGNVSLKIAYCDYVNTSYGYAIDEISNGAYLMNDVEFEGNTGSFTESEQPRNVVYATVDGKQVAFSTIQNAVNAADEKSEIIVAPGTYSGNVTFGGKSLTIKAQYPAYVDGVTEDASKISEFTGTFSTSGTTFNADQKVTICGFKFTGDGLKVGDMNWNKVGNLTVENCYMETGENLTTSTVGNNNWNYFVKVSGGAADGSDFANVIVRNNYITGEAVENVYPIQIWRVKQAAIVNNVISLTDADNITAISVSNLTPDATVEVSGNTIETVGGGIYITTWTQGGADFTGTVAVMDNDITYVKNAASDPVYVGYESAGHGDFAGRLNQGGNVVNDTAYNIVPHQKENSNVTYITVTLMDGKTVLYQYMTAKTDKGLEISLYPLSKNGYTFLGWKSSVDGKVYDAGETVTIYRDTTFTAQWLNNWGVIGGIIGGAGESDTFFTDVPGSAWYYDAVKFVYDYDLMDGVGNNKFNPDGTLTRAMIAQVLYNLEGASGAYPSVFTDVADSAWYAKAVNWAAASGIVEGKGNNKFDPNAPITRQEMAAILYRYAALKGYDVSKVDSLNGYTDASKVASWAKEAMGWAVENYVINGKGASRLDPTGTATRAQVAQILMNFCNNVL